MKSRTVAEKRAVLRAVQAMISPDREGGAVPLLTALARQRVSPATFYRWCDQEASGEWDKEKARGGRPAKFGGTTSRSSVAEDGHTLTADEISLLRWFNLQHDSAEFAVKRVAWFSAPEMLVDHEGKPRCPWPPARECVRAAINEGITAARKARRRYHPPLSLMRLAAVTDADRAMHRSRRATLPCQLSVPRDMTFRAECGTLFDLRPGSLIVADDHDCNSPSMQRDAEGTMQAVRQNVAFMDVATLAWLYNAALARRDNAYRLEDQAETAERVVSLHGWPKGFLIERGPWDNHFWLGTPLPAAWGEPEGAVWGGIAARCRVLPQFKPNGKSEIEKGFDRVQKIMAHQCVDVGRRRGEFERATKLVRLAKEGNAHALRQFWGLAAQADAIAAAMWEDSETPHARAAMGGKMVVPAEWWQADCDTTAVLPSERHLFCPLQLPRTVRRDGTVRVSDADYDRVYVFSVSGVFRGLQELDHGHRLFVSFHPGRADLGAWIHNAERATVRNRDALRYGEFLGMAPCVESRPRVVMKAGEDDDYSLPKKRSAAIAAEYRSIMPARGGDRDNFGFRRHSAEKTEVAARGDHAGAAPMGTDREPEAPAVPRSERGGVAALLRQRRGGVAAAAAVPAAAEDFAGALVGAGD